MTTVIGLTAARTLQIEAEAVKNGHVDEAGDLVLVRGNDTEINLGRPVLDDLTSVRAVYPALDNIESDLTFARVMVFGDSKAEGSTITALEDRWQNRLIKKLQTTYPVVGGDTGPGYLPAYYGTTDGVDALITYSGNYTKLAYSGGLGNRSVLLSPSGPGTITWPSQTYGDNLRVFYASLVAGGPYGTFEVLVDGDVVLSTDTYASQTRSGHYVDITIDPGDHVVSVRCTETSAAQVEIEGIEASTSQIGWRLYDSTHTGYSYEQLAHGWATNGAPESLDHLYECITEVYPQLAIFALGSEDLTKAETPVALAATLNLAITKFTDTFVNTGVVVLLPSEAVEDRTDGNNRYQIYEHEVMRLMANLPLVMVLREADLFRPRVGLDEQHDAWLATADYINISKSAHSMVANYLFTSFRRGLG